ncbi:MAG TPA: hypothetical protein VFI39_02005 [Gemmatimonadales bacterium]|nr:hypothetical protein [Gemmatimonadales bacterium]
MGQRVRLDRPAPLFYLVLVVAACVHAPAPVIPAALVGMPLDSAQAWSRETTPSGRWLHRFKWQYQDDRSAQGGRGSVHIAGPDSIRLDVAGPLGASPAAALIVADTAVWVRPEDAIHKLVPSYPLMWAMFGVARAPAGATLILAGRAGTTAVWRAVAGADTIDWARSATRLVAEVRRGGQVIGRAESRLGPDGQLSTARLSTPSVPARLDLTYTLSDASAHFPANVWRPREP